MSAFKTFVFLGGVALVILAGLPPCTHAQESSAKLPPEVLGFLSRRGACLEWSQKATDPERAVQIDSIGRSLKCSDIVNDERALRQRCASNPGILAALDATWVRVVKRLPVRIPVPSDLDR
jgi:hypothetical protein